MFTIFGPKNDQKFQKKKKKKKKKNSLVGSGLIIYLFHDSHM
jgi:hypothetical protein